MPRTLLICGVIAGPVYVFVAAIQILTRDGFDISKHSVSLLSIGDWGWVQISNFVVTGLLVVAAALGLRQVLDAGPASKWGPILIGIYGLGLIASGIFVADAAEGFPPGTPDGPSETVTWHGVLHFVFGGVTFLALIAATTVFARRFAEQRQGGWSAFSGITAAYFFVSFGLIATVPGPAAFNVMLTIAVVLGWAWLSMLAWKHLSSGTVGTTPIGQQELEHGART